MAEPVTNKQVRAFERFIESIEASMVKAVWRIVRNEQDFEEAFQQALTTIWNRLDQVTRHANPKAVALRICIHAGYDVFREKDRRRRRESDRAVEEEMIDTTRDGAQVLIDRERQEEVLAAIAQLPSPQAEIVLMRFGQELSHREIAQALDSTEAAVRQQICRARDKLSGQLAHLLPQTNKETAP